MPQLIEVPSDSTVRDTISAFGQDGDLLWIEGTDEELNGEVTLEGAGVHDRSHVHIHRCRAVELTVRYIDEERLRDFRPATTVRSILRWALSPDGFDIPEGERPEFGFLNCADGLAVADDVHVGSLTTPGQNCEACLTLAKKHNPQG